MDKNDFIIIYLFLSLDGRVTVREHNLFKEIMKHEGYDDADVKEIGRTTMNIISDAYSTENRESLIRHQFEKYSKDAQTGNTEHNRTVLWTLINLGFSDKSYSKAEQRLIHLYAKNMGLDKSYVLELEDAAKAMLSIINERESLEKFYFPNSIRKELAENQKILEKQVSALVSLG
ncbi:MAG: TerB family tellurite resistance protein [Treponema sp.]|nr:TerB family tellurite resistance protein [Treponema sp.]